MAREAWAAAATEPIDTDASRAPWSASQSPLRTSTLLESPAAHGSHSQPGTWHSMAQPPREVAGTRGMGRQACPWPLAPLPEADPPRSSSAVATAAAAAGPRWRPPQPTPRPLPPPALSGPTSSPPPLTAGEPAQAQEHGGRHQGQQPPPLRREGAGAGAGRPQAGRGGSGARWPLRPKGLPRGTAGRGWPESCLGWRCRVPGPLWQR